MNSTSVIDALKQQLSNDTIQEMSRTLGTDPNTTSNAISVAVPVMLAALSRNASSPQGAASLNDALGAHDGSVLDNIGGMLGGGGGIGGAILGHIFGSKRKPVEQGVGRATGMSAQQVGQLLMMLAPLIMGVLGRMKRHQDVGAQQLPDVLNQTKAEIETKSPEAAGLGRVFDTNHDGQIADDIARIGTSVLGGLFRQNA
jgi:hypothetical protein